MLFETRRQKDEIQRWSRLAIQLNGALDSGRCEHLTTEVIAAAVRNGTVFSLLSRELSDDAWRISKITDVDRHKLTQHWKALLERYEPQQFHVRRSGLALLVAYLLHMIDVLHAAVPQ